MYVNIYSLIKITRKDVRFHYWSPNIPSLINKKRKEQGHSYSLKLNTDYGLGQKGSFS